jgi:hypothetical protein
VVLAQAILQVHPSRFPEIVKVNEHVSPDEDYVVVTV